MAINLALTLTLDGKDAFWNSGNTGVKLDITHLEFGTRNRLPTGEESLLSLPEQSVKIQNGNKIGPDQVRIMATMPGIENYNVTEIGLWSGEPGIVGSILVAYTSVRTGFIAQMVAGIDLVFTYDMVIDTADIDNITIVKDTDQSSTFALLAKHEVDRNAHPFYVTTDTAQTISGAKTFTNKAIFSGGLTGELTGNAATATQLKTPRTIGGVSFNGTANINLPGVNIAGNQNTSGNAATASKLAAAVLIGGVSFNGTANINLPGVNIAGNQNTSGNAATASKLAAAVLIGGVAFDGSAAINLPGVNIAGNQNTSGNAATASKLAAARTISLTGDATGSLSFDGSANASAAVTLANTGIAAGTYKSVTIDAKGRATAGNDVVTGLVTAATAAGTANVATSNTNTFLNITEKVGAATASAGTSTQITGAGTVTVGSDAAGKITITGAQSITGNAATATKLQTPRTINNVAFDGSANIDVPIYTISRTAEEIDSINQSAFFRSDEGSGTLGLHIHNPTNDSYGFQIHQSGTYAKNQLKTRVKSGGTWSSYRELAYTDSSITGNAATASKLAAARTISLTGDATGSLSFDGSGNASAAVTLANTGIAAGTYKSVTIDAKGRATAGNDVVTGLVTAATAAGTANVATSNTNTFLNITEKVGAATASAGTSTQITGAGTVTVASDAAGKITITGAQSITGNAATATRLATARTINGVSFDGSANITVADDTKLPLSGGTLTGLLTLPTILMNKSANAKAAISWYQSSYNAWQDYMAQAASTGNGANGNITAPTGTLVTTWGRRSFIENQGGYGWTFESGTLNATAPTIVAEIRSSDGAARFGGAVTAPSFIGALTGNAATATQLANARTINGVAFDGTANITVYDATKLPTAGGTITGGLTVNGSLGVTSFHSTSAYSFLNGGNAQNIHTGGVLASNSYADASKVPTNGIYSKGNIETAGTMSLGSSNLKVVSGTNYTVTYDYATRIAQIDMKIINAVGVSNAASPFTWENNHFIARIMLPIALKKRLHTEVFFNAVANSVTYHEEALEWLIWTSPAGYRGATDNLVVIDAIRWTGGKDEAIDGHLIVTGFF